jgi:glutathionylspermidine synthase
VKFQPIEARADWRELATELGFLSTVFDDPPYWVEALDQPFCAVFSSAETNDLIIPATATLIDLANQTVDAIVSGPRSQEYYDRLKTPIRCREAIKASWLAREESLWGRMDFSYSNGALKLLEFNFDGAISLYEASVFQRLWLDQLIEKGTFDENTGQVNAIHTSLIAAFDRLIPADGTVHFTSLGMSTEEDETIKYLQSCAMLAGKHTQYLKVKSLGHTDAGMLVDLNKAPIKQLVKLYPWELLFREDTKIAEQTGKSVLLPLVEKQSVHFIEPAWKSLLSNKGVLSIMYELFPDCPYLLPAALEGSEAAAELKKHPYAKKPLFGMQGVSVSLVYPDDPLMSTAIPGEYGREGFVIQQLHPLPTYQDYHVLLGSWVVAGKPAGLGMRADRSAITTGTHCLFVPHIVED